MEQVKNWYAIYTKPRNEKKVTERLLAKGLDMYCPLYETYRQWSDRKKKVKLPMFTSYIFAHVSITDFDAVRKDPGVLNFVYWLGKPAIITDWEIENIRRITGLGTDIVVESYQLKQGDQVTIKEGPFKGLCGSIEESKETKLTVYIEQLACKIMFNYPKLELETHF